MTPAERKKAERQRKRSAGLVPLEVWVKPQDEKHIRRAEAMSQQGQTFWVMPETAKHSMVVMPGSENAGLAEDG